ncbi:hypothetical protein Hanom_Chr00s000003g01602521 [Helianthus anomalus]
MKDYCPLDKQEGLWLDLFKIGLQKEEVLLSWVVARPVQNRASKGGGFAVMVLYLFIYSNITYQCNYIYM